MKNIIENSTETGSHAGKNTTRVGKSASYRSPQIVELGKAGCLVRNSITGHIRDYSGSWYVWGS